MIWINEILFWVCWFVLMWNGYFLLVNRGVPNIKTAPRIRKAIIEVLKEDRQRHEGKPYRIIDLGSGNGFFSRQIARAIPDAEIMGIEVSYLAYWHSVLRKKIFGPQNLHYIRADFYEVDIAKADAVVMFLLGRFMRTIRQKLEADLKEGTLVISNKFKVGGEWVPRQIVDVKTLAPHQKTFYVYER